MSLLRQRDQRTNPAHRSADSRTRLIKRAASLLVVGICCSLIWQTYFLCFYSICIAIGALLLTASNRWLWALAFIFILIWAAFTFWLFPILMWTCSKHFKIATLGRSKVRSFAYPSIDFTRYFLDRCVVNWYVVRTVEGALSSGTKGHVLRWNHRCSSLRMHSVATGSLYSPKRLGLGCCGNYQKAIIRADFHAASFLWYMWNRYCNHWGKPHANREVFRCEVGEAVHRNGSTCPDALRRPSNYRQGAAWTTWGYRV